MEAAPFIPVSEPLIGDNTLALVTECVDTGWVSSEGRFIAEFERKFSQFCGAAHGVAVSNGTTALQVAMRALSLEPGSEVIMPSYTIISCAIAMCGSSVCSRDMRARNWPNLAISRHLPTD